MDGGNRIHVLHTDLRLANFGFTLAISSSVLSLDSCARALRNGFGLLSLLRQLLDMVTCRRMTGSCWLKT